MRADLLIRGAELLEADPAKGDGVRFDLATWAAPYDEADPKKFKFDTEPERVPINCYTRACAMGLFCLSDAFKNEGLGYSLEERAAGYELVPTLGHNYGYYAARTLFGISFR